MCIPCSALLPVIPNGQHGVLIETIPETPTSPRFPGNENTIEDNVIYYNQGNGVTDKYTKLDPRNEREPGNTIRRNAFYRNVGLGIDVGPDGVTSNDVGDIDGFQNFLHFLKKP